FRHGPRALAMVLVACSPIEPPAPRRAPAVVRPSDEYNPPPGPPVPPVVAAAPVRAPDRPSIAWPAALTWKSWPDATRDARLHNRPILLVVYAEWCPHCHELA